MINQEFVQRKAEERFKRRMARRRENVKQLGRLREGKGFDWTRVERPNRLAERARRMGLFEDAGAILRDPTNAELGKRVFERIIDANNLLGVTFLFEGARMAQAVGRVTLPVPGGNKLGTGFMVSSRIMMTNNHVLGDQSEAAKASLEFDFYEREDGTTAPVIVFNLQPDRFFVTDADLDFTLVAVDAVNANGVSVSNRGWFPLVGPSGKAIVGERVSIIQHPNGDPQKVSVHDNKIVDVDFNDNFIHYETDTMGGSSGSPVLNIDWDLVALHHAAVGKSNEGVRVSSIVTRLREIFEQESAVSDVNIDPTLAAELMAARAPAKNSVLSPANFATPVNETAPRLNADGTASWVVPITVTLGVGQAFVPRGAVVGSVVTTTPKTEPTVGEPAVDDTTLNMAMHALDETEGLVYYDEEEDKNARDEYYPDLDGLDKTELYHRFNTLLTETHTKTLSYKAARLNHLYPWIDRRAGDSQELRGVYSHKVFDALEIIRQEARMEAQREKAIRERVMRESLESVDDVFLEELEAAYPYNCEHVVPQSWFNKKKQPRTDLHHLFTCEWGCNSFRGNRAYYEFEIEAYRENCGNSDNSKFEPMNSKGAVARATLYFLIHYPGEVADSSKEMPKERLETLIKWAKEEDVDIWERHRNAEIQKLQGNRNPLIDFPELVDKIDFKLGWA